MKNGWAIIGVLLLGACASQEQIPVAPPPPIEEVAPPPQPAEQSQASKRIAAYYADLQARQIDQGRMRTDGGGTDAPFDTDDLVTNFERIAFFEEYARGGRLGKASENPNHLIRWTSDIRLHVQTGASLGPEAAIRNKREVATFAARLTRLTGQKITLTDREHANFLVIFGGYDDTAQTVASVQDFAPDLAPSAMSIVRFPPRDIDCFVITLSPRRDPVYSGAIAYIRGEHPDLFRKACIHEELSQAMGLPNDSPSARPSIFNDDDEFALLTRQDEMMLRILYDPRLRAGMSLPEAHPIITQIAQELIGPSS